MNRRGELSQEVAPTLLFHSSYLLDEEQVLWWKKLVWKSPKPAIYLQALNDGFWNVALLVKKSQREAVETAMGEIPFRRIYEYDSMEDIRELSFRHYENIVAYYDTNSQRGCWFRDRWKT